MWTGLVLLPTIKLVDGTRRSLQWDGDLHVNMLPLFDCVSDEDGGGICRALDDGTRVKSPTRRLSFPQSCASYATVTANTNTKGAGACRPAPSAPRKQRRRVRLHPTDPWVLSQRTSALRLVFASVSTGTSPP